ncbi:hypothetical protein predicted by Glimmer/Critica [Bdellovibrio bacteriovorus HD100]|uniref:Uncharacterized protein n=2 Tax=Bdellovibrio bacteriovorus TaxID=959 RepID=Q6MMG9_BDEBA|nr:hypothetical protein predicted by Glimmer/Critica [Bdellovibrio bacteriovorus HD100]
MLWDMTKLLITVMAVFGISTSAMAFELAQGLTPPGRQRTTLNYVGFFYDKAEFPQERANMRYQLMDLSSPVYKTETQSVGLSFSGSQMSVDPAQNGYSELYDIKFGASYTKVLGEKRMWSVMVNYGSASDKPFYDPTVSTLGITAFYSYPSDEKSSWLLLANYSNNRPILNNIPLPGFAWFYYPSRELNLVLGAPFASINWQFADKFGLTFFTLVPWVIKSTVYYKLNDFAQVYAGMDFSQVTYLPYGRENREDRLFYDEKKFLMGIKSPLSKSVFADFEVGHAFDRRFFIAENYEINPGNQVDIGNAYYAKLALRVAFQ